MQPAYHIATLQATCSRTPSTERVLSACLKVWRCGMVGGLLLASLAMHGQDSLLMHDYAFVKGADAWLTSRNAASLTQFASHNIANAQLSLTREKGGFTDFSDSPDAFTVNAEVESFYRIGSRVVGYGLMCYENFSGKEMGGSAFIDTSRLPFDLEEDSLTNLGRKHRDTYHLTGGVGIDVWRGISLGARLDYKAANYAKYKDLRHKNKLMDMTLTTGVFWPIAGMVDVGAFYYYRRTTESLKFNLYGREDKTYVTFINYGPFIGETEQFANSGFTDKLRELPMVSNYNGIGLQLGLHWGSNLTFTNEATLAYREGYYGRRSEFTNSYSFHHSHTYDYHGRLSYRVMASVHHIDVNIGAENLVNYFETFREKRNDSGASYYEYYDPVKTANKLWVEGRVAYTAYLGIRGELPTWAITASCRWMHRKQTAYDHPYYRRQRLNNQEWGLAATRNMLLRKGLLSLSLSGAFLNGNGAPFENLTFVAPSDKQHPSPTMDTWLYREHQWLTAAQYAVGGSAKYTFRFPGTRMATYVGASVRHHKVNAPNAYSNGRDHTQATLFLGCTF